jgi:subtilisin family serine protease
LSSCACRCPIDLGFDDYKRLLGKTLPERVTAKSFVSGHDVDQSDEIHGTACAEIVHAMAPDAELYLAYYNGSETGLGRAVEWLVSQNVHIISHSANGLVGPMDGTGSQSRLVDGVASKGILWVNSSGNYATEHYTFTFDDEKGDGKHVFPDGAQALLYNPPSEDARIVLNWDDWGHDSTEDYDLYLYDSSGKLVAASEESQQGQPGDRPVEAIRMSAPKQKSYYIVIIAKQITRPAVFNLFALDSRLGYTSPEYSLGTPGDARGALTVGAIAWRTSRLESFSSQGPTMDNRLKPEITAPDGVTTQSYRPRAFNGTSASTPHVAGAAALVMSRFPDLKAADVAAFLASNAVDLGPSGPDAAYGRGRLQLPPVTQAQPQPAQPQPPVIVTVQPVGAQPGPGQGTGAGATTGVLACLSLLVCGGAVGSLGGLALLLVLARPKPRPVPAPPFVSGGASPHVPGVPLRPAVQPSVRPQPPAPPMTALALVGMAGQRITLRMGKSTVGRTPENEIHLDDPQVSRRHAEITWDGVRCTVTDLGSSNGTFVNSRRLTPNLPETIRPGDRVLFGTSSAWTVTAGS